MVADKLTSAIFAQIILFVRRLFAIFLPLCSGNRGNEVLFLFSFTKIQFISLIVSFLQRHTFGRAQFVQQVVDGCSFLVEPFGGNVAVVV
jgi:hypothetical protein